GSGLGTLTDQQAVAFARLYRRAASDLNQAQTFISGEATAAYLNDLVARCYLVIHAKSKIDLRALLRAMFRHYPLVFRRYLGYFLAAAAVFTLGAVFGFLASYFDTGAARSYLLPADMPMIEPGKEGPVLPTGQLAQFSALLFRHN